MKQFILAASLAALAFSCKSDDSMKVSDPSNAAAPDAACATACSDTMKAECSDSMKVECSDAAKKECSGEMKPECSTTKTCPMTGAVSE